MEPYRGGDDSTRRKHADQRRTSPRPHPREPRLALSLTCLSPLVAGETISLAHAAELLIDRGPGIRMVVLMGRRIALSYLNAPFVSKSHLNSRTARRQSGMAPHISWSGVTCRGQMQDSTHTFVRTCVEINSNYYKYICEIGTPRPRCTSTSCFSPRTQTRRIASLDHFSGGTSLA